MDRHKIETALKRKTSMRESRCFPTISSNSFGSSDHLGLLLALEMVLLLLILLLQRRDLFFEGKVILLTLIRGQTALTDN